MQNQIGGEGCKMGVYTPPPLTLPLPKDIESNIVHLIIICKV